VRRALGRMHTKRAEVIFQAAEDRRHEPGYLLWLAVPAALVVLAVALRLAGVAEIGWWRLAAAVLVPLVIAGSSVVVVVAAARHGDRRMTGFRLLYGSTESVRGTEDTDKDQVP
jgi:hypothetical protein